MGSPAVWRGRALGTDVVLAVTAPHGLADARAIVDAELAALDRACSRFRTDSEIWLLEGAAGAPRRVSPLLIAAVCAALSVAEQTGGAVDPTVGNALVALGYDRDFAALAATETSAAVRPSPAIGWWSVLVDEDRATVQVPAGVLLDLGATAKAFAADRCAARVADALGCGVLISLGGDIAVAGEAPVAGWPVGISLRSGEGNADLRQRLAIRSGGLASSSPSVRSWRRAGRALHHIVDPASGEPAAEHWRLVSVAAASCLEANAASTAAIVWGAEAVDRLSAMAVPARLEHVDGAVTAIGGWPTDESARPGAAAPPLARAGGGR